MHVCAVKLGQTLGCVLLTQQFIERSIARVSTMDAVPALLIKKISVHDLTMATWLVR